MFVARDKKVDLGLLLLFFATAQAKVLSGSIFCPLLIWHTSPWYWKWEFWRLLLETGRLAWASFSFLPLASDGHRRSDLCSLSHLGSVLLCSTLLCHCSALLCSALLCSALLKGIICNRSSVAERKGPGPGWLADIKILRKGKSWKCNLSMQS